MGLTGVQRIVVECIRRRNHYGARVVAGPASLYWVVVGGAGLVGLVQRRLQHSLLRVVLRHAPHLCAHDVDLGLGNRCAGDEEWEREDQEIR